MDIFLNYVLLSFAALAVFMSLGWIISVVIKDASIADRLWGPGFVLVAWLALWRSGASDIKSLLVAVLTTLWGLRLALHIAVRSAGKGEDKRYVNMRAESGDSFVWISFFKVFMLQGFILLLNSLALIFAITGGGALRLLDYFALVLWSAGFAIEATADWQLLQFKKKSANAGRIMQGGLWAFSRHPNYFGETLVWWSVFLFALSRPYGYLTVISPLLITWLLLKVSGVALLEKVRYSGDSEYERYKARVSPFIPLPPKK